MTRSPEELKAMAYALVDEIETKVLARIARGMSREQALMLTVMEMGGTVTTQKGN